jgi:hypothetical protein
MARKKKTDGTDDEKDTNADGVVDERDAGVVAGTIDAGEAAARLAGPEGKPAGPEVEAQPAKSTDSDLTPGIDPAVASAAQVPATAKPLGFRQFEIRIPGCTLPTRVVEAETEQAALAKYMADLGVTGLPSAPSITGADAPAAE